MCLISSPPLLPSDDKCSKKCPDSVTPITAKEAPPVLPLYNHQNGESCVIRTSVEEDSSGNIYKSILVSGGNSKRLLLWVMSSPQVTYMVLLVLETPIH